MTSPDVPRPPRGRGLLLGGLLTGLLVASGAFALWTVAAGSEALHSEAGQQVHRQPVTDVDIDLNQGSVALVAGAPDAVTVQSQVSWGRARPTLDQRIVGRTLQIRGRCPRLLLGRSDQCQIDLAVEVPPTVAVKANVDVGGIRADGLAGRLQLVSYGGGITLTGTKGPLWVRSGGGSIVGTDVSGLDVDVKAGWADVSLRFTTVPDHVQAEAEHGDVTVAVPVAGPGLDGYLIRGGTRNGRRNIDVQQDPNGRHTIAAVTGDGDIDVRYATVR